VEIVDASGKVQYTLGVGTSHARSLALPADQRSKMFDEWFTLLARMQSLAESDPKLRHTMQKVQRGNIRSDDEVRAKILLHVIPLIQSLWCLWTYTASDNAALRHEISELRAQHERDMKELRDRLAALQPPGAA
jgi:hypothetical protein